MWMRVLMIVAIILLIVFIYLYAVACSVVGKASTLG